MDGPERIDLTRATRAVIWSANLGIPIFLMLCAAGLIGIPLMQAGRVGSLVESLMVVAVSAQLVIVFYPVLYFLAAVWRVIVLYELIALLFGFVIAFLVTAPAVSLEYICRLRRLPPGRCGEGLPFALRDLLLFAIEHYWLLVYIMAFAVALPFVVAAWRFRRLRAGLKRNGVTMAYRPWRKAGFRSQMQAVPRARIAVALLFYGLAVLAMMSVSAALVGDFTDDMEVRMLVAGGFAVVVVVLFRIGHGLMRSAARQSMRRLGQVLQSDRRAPVVFLRSFNDDHTQIRSWRKPMLWPFMWKRFGSESSFEEALTIALTDFGPVVAIGRPGEAGVPVGAAREYVADDAWQQRVEDLIAQAALVVILIGDTRGLAWEAERLLQPDVRARVLFAVPPVGRDEAERRWQAMRRHAAEAGADVAGLPEQLGDTLVFSPAGPRPRLYCARDRSQDRFELALLVAGRDATGGRVPVEKVRAFI